MNLEPFVAPCPLCGFMVQGARDTSNGVFLPNRGPAHSNSCPYTKAKAVSLGGLTEFLQLLRELLFCSHPHEDRVITVRGVSLDQTHTTCRRCGAWRVTHPQERPDVFKHGKMVLATSPDIFTVEDIVWNRPEFVKKLFELLEVE